MRLVQFVAANGERRVGRVGDDGRSVQVLSGVASTYDLAMQAAREGRSLADLAMPRTRCDVRFADAASESAWTPRGIEQAEFYISPNPGEDLRPLARIASGGELSRIMLALKSLASTDAPGKTLIFDEVDTGIGGAAADVVGARLQRLAERCQVLCITHLPQVAAFGRTQFLIQKQTRGRRTVTSVEKLSRPQRVEELARMMGGADAGQHSRSGAQELLDAAQAKGETRAKAKGESSRGRRHT